MERLTDLKQMYDEVNRKKYIVLYVDDGNIAVVVKKGFAWNVFFFGFFATLYESDSAQSENYTLSLRLFFVPLICACLISLLFLSHFLLCFAISYLAAFFINNAVIANHYNAIILKNYLESSWKPLTPEDRYAIENTVRKQYR